MSSWSGQRSSSGFTRTRSNGWRWTGCFPPLETNRPPREEVEYHAERVMRWKENADPEEHYRLACKQMTLRELEEKRQAGGIWNERDILGD